MAIRRVYACTVLSAQPRGCVAYPVRVRVELGEEGSIPGLSIMGMPDSYLLEARSRVRSAILSCGFELPRRAMSVTLEPDGLRKTGTGFDLSIALGILAVSGQVDPRLTVGRLFYGELSPSGEVRAPRGTVCAQACARDAGAQLVTSSSAQTVEGLGEALGISSLTDLRREGGSAGAAFRPIAHTVRGEARDVVDFGSVSGYAREKRRLAAAVAGRLSVLLVGTDRAPLRELAECVPSVLREDHDAWLENALCRSAAGIDVRGEWCDRPLHEVGSGLSLAGLVGGGRPVLPGEVSLANGGVLLVRNADEFTDTQLRALSCVCRDGASRLVRVDGQYEMPASFLMVGTCVISSGSKADDVVRRLQGFFDMVVRVPDPEAMAETTYTSEELRRVVETARGLAITRQGDEGLRDGHGTTCIVARALADVDGAERVGTAHLREAEASARP